MLAFSILPQKEQAHSILSPLSLQINLNSQTLILAYDVEIYTFLNQDLI